MINATLVGARFLANCPPRAFLAPFCADSPYPCCKFPFFFRPPPHSARVVCTGCDPILFLLRRPPLPLPHPVFHCRFPPLWKRCHLGPFFGFPFCPACFFFMPGYPFVIFLLVSSCSTFPPFFPSKPLFQMLNWFRFRIPRSLSRLQGVL